MGTSPAMNHGSGIDMAVAQWSFWTLCLYVAATLYVIGFFVFYVRFRLLERNARTLGGAAVSRYNRALRGFPNSMYAKMLGKRPLESGGTRP